MSTNPSNRTRSVYNGSVVDNTDTLKSKRIPSRKDSTAPLLHTPPMPVGLGEDPLDAKSFNRDNSFGVSGSYARHHGAHSRTALRRRRNSESSESSLEEVDLPDPNVELNTSDEEQSDFDSDEESGEDESNDEDDNTIHNHLTNTANDTRISGLNEIPRDTRDEQLLLLEEEDVQIRIYGYKYNKTNLYLYRLCSILSFGLVWLVLRWMPRWHISWVGIKVPMDQAEWLVFKVRRM